MRQSAKFLLDSGDPDEYRKLAILAKDRGSELWGSTTNPSLVAKKLSGKMYSLEELHELQKKIVLEIINIVPGAVSAEVYADHDTKAEEMIKQGREIATWHKRVVVKLPTTIEGFKARTVLRSEKIPTNNTLVFSQEQIFAICLHEQILRKTKGAIGGLWPPFVSPFVGRLDDIGTNGMGLVKIGMKIKTLFKTELWMLVASVRRVEHIFEAIKLDTESITAPLKSYDEWFKLSDEEQNQINPHDYQKELTPIPLWDIPPRLLEINTIDDFMLAIESGELNIDHKLTTQGITKFVDDWKAILK